MEKPGERTKRDMFEREYKQLCVKLFLRQEGDVLKELTSEERLGLGIQIWKQPVKTSLSELTTGRHRKRGPRTKLQEGSSLSRSWEEGTKGTENQRLQEEFAKVGGVGL